ncbi:hypothetical protein CL621_03495 [archaeon]|nr:hypothetical protein [archaeon]|tara:strand:+ start:3643 stop:4026 length:384 start_codon:yes stop_codon:yes gene_type:complete
MKISIDLNECCEKALEWKYLRGKIDHQQQHSICPTCETSYSRREKGKVIYVKHKGGDKYICGNCDSDILAIFVHHPINTHLPQCGGERYREKDTERVSYCPTCEEKPNSRGSKIEEICLNNLQFNPN